MRTNTSVGNRDSRAVSGILGSVIRCQHFFGNFYSGISDAMYAGVIVFPAIFRGCLAAVA